jgi:hypothetical protein
MAGNITWKERAIVTLQDRTNTTALTNLSGAAAATADLDVRAAGNAADDQVAMFELLCRYGTITGILFGVAVAELYLVPLIDGTNLPDVDLTAGASHVAPNAFVGKFLAAKQLVTATDTRFALGPVVLFPCLYRAYIINTAGQTMTTTSGTSWQLRVVSAQGQYT